MPVPSPVPPIGLVFALEIEAGGMLDRLQHKVTTTGQGYKGQGFTIVTGHLPELSSTLFGSADSPDHTTHPRDRPAIAIAYAGAGKQAATVATQALIAGHHPRWVISAGFAGALQPELAVGDLLLPTGVQNAQGEKLAIDVQGRPPPPGEAKIHHGWLYTADRVVTTAASKLALGQSSEALAVDLETFAVAQLCVREKLRFLAVRIISDHAGEDLPPDVAGLMRPQSTARLLGRVLGGIFRRPQIVPELWRLREQALLATDRLADFLCRLMPLLP
ncbi:MAG: hypothetical protein SFX18_04185 [Pirellulales bacterium]|nr:hypothetical protein [Pirellulales bacterium]